jgi:hypothetical protein
MATAYEEADDRGTSRGTRKSSTTGTRSRTSAGARGAAAGLSTAAMFEIVERLGLVDMVVDRIKARLEEVDVDDLLDDIGDYLKRNPEVLVVSLGAVTIAAGALVYLNKRNDSSRTSRPKTSSR